MRPIQSKDMHVSMTLDSKLDVGMIMIVNTCLSLCVRYDVPRLLPHDNWDCSSPCNRPKLDKQKKMYGWMKYKFNH